MKSILCAVSFVSFYFLLSHVREVENGRIIRMKWKQNGMHNSFDANESLDSAEYLFMGECARLANCILREKELKMANFFHFFPTLDWSDVHYYILNFQGDQTSDNWINLNEWKIDHHCVSFFIFCQAKRKYFFSFSIHLLLYEDCQRQQKNYSLEEEKLMRNEALVKNKSVLHWLNCAWRKLSNWYWTRKKSVRACERSEPWHIDKKKWDENDLFFCKVIWSFIYEWIFRLTPSLIIHHLFLAVH